MAHYIVLANSISAKYGKTYLKGQIITDEQITANHAPELLDQKFIRVANTEELAGDEHINPEYE